MIACFLTPKDLGPKTRKITDGKPTTTSPPPRSSLLFTNRDSITNNDSIVIDASESESNHGFEKPTKANSIWNLESLFKKSRESLITTRRRVTNIRASNHGTYTALNEKRKGGTDVSLETLSRRCLIVEEMYDEPQGRSKKRKVVSLQVGSNKRTVHPVSYATNPDELSAIPAAMSLGLTMEPHNFDYYEFAKRGSGLPFGYGTADKYRMPHESQLHDNVRIVRNQHDADEAYDVEPLAGRDPIFAHWVNAGDDM
jgi:hypothetical protein